MKSQKLIINQSGEKIIPFVWVNGQVDTYDIEVVLKGEGSSVTIVGLFFGSGNKKISFNTKVIHVGGNTKSLTTMRGVFFDESDFAGDGVVRIEKGAKAADGYFASKILLFNNAKGKSVPSLEIDENDLKAGHASTVGRPDPMQLFYLRSRGLSEKASVKLLISGFFEPVLKFLPQVEQKSFRNRLSEYL